MKQGESTQFAEIYTKKMAGEHMFHGKSGNLLSTFAAIIQQHVMRVSASTSRTDQ